jgi:hypothetical protein
MDAEQSKLVTIKLSAAEHKQHFLEFHNQTKHLPVLDMGHITDEDAIAIFELIYYSPCLFGSLFVAFRHGAMKSSGWIFLTIFCLVRVIGSAARIATITHPTSKDAYTIALVTTALGLPPLPMASLGLISRA